MTATTDDRRPTTDSAQRLAITPPPLCDFNTKLLSTKQRRALLLCGLPQRLYRQSGNRYGRHPSVVAYDTVIEMVGLGLFRIDRNTGPHPFPVLTGAGRQVRAVLMERKRK